MKVCNLNCNHQLHVIICVEHGSYIALRLLKEQLQRLHGIKGERLHAALIEVAQLHVRDPRQMNAFVDIPSHTLPSD